MKKKVTQQDKMYYLGLDIGTDSVGWAVTDCNYKLLRANNKSLWGVRLFDEAQQASGRRLQRESRRRLERRKRRIYLLQQIFAPVINAKDPNFFARLVGRIMEPTLPIRSFSSNIKLCTICAAHC